MLGPEDAIKRWNDQVSTLKEVPYIQSIARIGWRTDWLRVEYLPKSHSIGHSPRKFGRSATKHVTPENFSDRITSMSMFNDIVLEKKENEDYCATTPRKIKEYAGHSWGPGEESKWYQGYATDYGGKWDLRASQMVDVFVNSGHPIFQGVLKKKNNGDTIHFNGEYCNIDLLYRTVYLANHLCTCGAVTKWCENMTRTNSGEETSREIQIKQEDLKSLVDIPRLPHASGNRTLQSLKDFKRCHFWTKWNISVQRRNSTIWSRKEIIMLQLLLKKTDGKTHVNVQRKHSAKKSGGFKAIRINWCRTRSWSSLKYRDCYSYWCSWYWSTSTITEFTFIVRMDFDKSWSRKICEWNSLSQLWHCELQFFVSREGRKLR